MKPAESGGEDGSGEQAKRQCFGAADTGSAAMEDGGIAGGACAGAGGHEEDEEWMAQHPLCIELVLKKVFKHCPELEEVKRNRLVCRTWKAASERQWIELTSLTLYRQAEDMETIEGAVGLNHMTLRQLRELCEGAGVPLKTVVRYRKFKLEGWEFNAQLIGTLEEEVDQAEDLLQDERWFWKTIAPNLVTQLSVDRCSFPETLVIFEDKFLRAFPNLESLVVLQNEASALAMDEAIKDWPPRHPTCPLPKLRSVTVTAPWQEPFRFFQKHNWGTFLENAPNLELLRVRGPEREIGQKWRTFLETLFSYDLGHVAATLKHLDILDFSMVPFYLGIMRDLDEYEEDENFDSLEVLRCDIGCMYGYVTEDMQAIANRMRNLRELYIYQDPHGEPTKGSFLGGGSLPTLRELHLWGIFCSNMSFLNGLPNLQVLVWTTSAYDEEHHGQRLFKSWETGESYRPQKSRDFVAASPPLPVLNQMRTLKLDWAPNTQASFVKLRASLPNLTSLKMRVTRTEQLDWIREQWNGLQELGFAHGSFFDGERLINGLTSFSQLKSFVWTGCACTKQMFNDAETRELKEMEMIFKTELPDKVEFPWNYTETNGGTMCIRGRYENALRNGNRGMYTNYV